jgi:hypothetical protein
LSGDLSRILRVSLWPPDFNFQIANPESGFEIGRDWFDGSSRVSYAGRRRCAVWMMGRRSRLVLSSSCGRAWMISLGMAPIELLGAARD